MKKQISSIACSLLLLLTSCSKEKLNSKELEDTTWKVTSITFKGNDGKNYDAEANSFLQEASLTVHFNKDGSGESVSTELSSNTSQKDLFHWDVSSDGKGVNITDDKYKDTDYMSFTEENKKITTLKTNDTFTTIDIDDATSVEGIGTLIFKKQ